MALADVISPNVQNESFDIYDLGDQLLQVAHDRLVAAGQTLDGLIPNKGRAVRQLAVYWYELFESILGSSFVSTEPTDLPDRFAEYADELDGRFMLMAKVRQFPIRALVHGYLTADLLDEYLETGTVGGVDALPGMSLNSQMEQCIYIPWLTDQNHPDQPGQRIDLMKTIELYGTRDGMVLCSNALELYEIIHGLARSRGLIFANIQLGFGQIDEQIVVTEVPGVDSSTIWSADGYEPGDEQQPYVFADLNSWLVKYPDLSTERPAMPVELIAELSRRYVEVTEMVTGEEFE